MVASAGVQEQGSDPLAGRGLVYRRRVGVRRRPEYQPRRFEPHRGFHLCWLRWQAIQSLEYKASGITFINQAISLQRRVMYTCVCRLRIAATICRAAVCGEAIQKRFPAAIGVSTNPGCTSVTTIGSFDLVKRYLTPWR